jgi:RNA polymerase sigma factor (sigma-70 family)
MNGPTDAELLKRYLTEGAEEAFAALVERHAGLVYGVALRHVQGTASAQEVTQEVFITLARRAVWLSGQASLGGWLFRTTIHLAQHESRAEQRRRRRERIASEMGTCMKSDESLLSRIGPVLDEAMLELRAPDREALVLRYFGNQSLREVGAALGVQEDAAQKRVSKALEALAERFRRRGFRVAGVSTVALALEQASAQALPAGLALSATQAALTAGTAASLGSLSLPILKFMSLTKIQTAALCLAVAALPLGYQWHALNRARSLSVRLGEQLQTLRTEALVRERDQARAERRVAALQSQLAATSIPRPAVPGTAPARRDQANYVWDEHSAYIRVPKQLLGRVRFAPYAVRTGPDGKAERYQLPPLAADGTPQPVLEAALGLSAEETARLRELCLDAFARFSALAASHSVVKEGQPLGGSGPSVELSTSAFAEEGAQFRDQFRSQLTDLLGPERTEVFWGQTAPMFTEVFNDFGAYPRNLQLVKSARNGWPLLNTYRNSSHVCPLSERNGMPIPQMLQAYADAWTQEQAGPDVAPSQP